MPESPTSSQMLQEELDASEAVYSQNILLVPPELTLFDPADLAAYEKPQQGFYGEVFEDSSGNVIIAFEGTSSNLPGAVSADTLIAGGISPPALQDAVNFVQEVQLDLAKLGLGSASVYITGHSLGGAESEAVAYDASIGALGPITGGVTFGAPGLPGYSNFFGTTSPSNFTNYVDLGDPVGNAAFDESSELFGFTADGSHFGNVTTVGLPDLVPVSLTSLDEYVIGNSLNYLTGLDLLNADLPTHELQHYAADLEKQLFDETTVSSTQAEDDTNLDSAFNSSVAQNAVSQLTTGNNANARPVITNQPIVATLDNAYLALADLFPAVESSNSYGRSIVGYTITYITGPGQIVLGGQTYSAGSTINNVSPAQFVTAYFSAGPNPGVNEIEVTAFDNAGTPSAPADTAIEVAAPDNSQPINQTNTTPPTVSPPTQALVVAVGESQSLSSNFLQVTDSAGYSPGQLNYTITSKPSNGWLVYNGSIVSTFTQAQIDNDQIQYQEDGTAASSDSFSYYVSDPNGNQTPVTTADIQISPVPASTAPSLTADSTLSVGQGLSAVITDSNLDVTDSGVNSWQIIYTIRSGPQNGEVVVGGSQPVTFFTQQELDLGLIDYLNGGDVSGTDSFTFTVSDGQGGTIGQSTFDIDVIPKNNLSVTVARPLSNDQEPDNPTIPGTNTPRAYSLVGPDVLSASDPGVAPQDITYTVDSVPQDALGFRVGTWDSSGTFAGTAPATTFTQAEVDAGEVFYAGPFGPVDISGQEDTVTLSASDNVGNSVSNITLPIILYPNGLLTNGQFLSQEPFVANMAASIGQSAVVGIGLLDFLAPWFTDDQIQYEVWTTPSDGNLYLNGVQLTPNDAFNANSSSMFSQTDINDGDLTYVATTPSSTPDEFGLFVTDPSGSLWTIQVFVSETGSDGGQVLSGVPGAETLQAGAGNNYFIGDGNTTVSYQNSPNGLTINLQDQTADNGYGGVDTFENIHSVIGSPENNTFIAEADVPITLSDAAMAAAGALSVVNTFNGNGGTVTYYAPISFDGFTLTNLDRTDFAFTSINSGFAAANGYFFDGAQVLEVPAGGNTGGADTIRIEQENGQQFSAQSIDLDSITASPSTTVTFTGLRADGTTVTQTFDLDNTEGLQSFQFDSDFTNLLHLDLDPSNNVFFDDLTVVPGSQGADTFVGGGGTDTVVFSGPEADYTIIPDNGNTVVSGNGYTDTLTDISLAQFSDTTVSLSEGNSPCYCRGTLILTNRSERPVEELAIGDEVLTADGARRPIKWIGKRRYGGRFVMGRKDILPVCIKAGALDDNVPKRDLWISPHHAMYLDGVLIEAKDIVNGVSIVQAGRVDKLEYFHVELESHDVIIAEGALSETFLDDNSRGMFHNAHEYAALYPDSVAAPARYCAPRLEDGYEVEAARRYLAQRAGILDGNSEIGRLRGFVDLVGPHSLEGWAQNIDHPEVPVCLDMFAGDKRIGQALANRYREDLKRAGLGSGQHSFAFELPEGLAFDLKTLEVRRSLDGAQLPMSHACVARISVAA